MTSLSQQVQELRTNVNRLPPGQRDFALSLVGSFQRKHSLSFSQADWVGKLLTSINTPKPELSIDTALKAEGVNLSPVLALFAKAKSHLVHPKIVLQIDGDTFQLTLAGPTAKAPGSINITSGGSFQDPSRKWYGRITVAGDWQPSGQAEAVKDKLTALLKQLAINPAAVATAFGKLTGNCCFCNKTLTDPRSTHAGFGPICAEHYGLSAEWAAAAGGL